MCLPGVQPDCWGMIELPSGRATLFVPHLGPEYAIWMGKIKSRDYFRDYYGVDECLFVNDLKSAVSGAVGGGGAIYILSGTNTDSGLNIANVLPTAEGLPDGVSGRPIHPSRTRLQPTLTRSNLAVDSTTLYNIAANCRAIKSPDEVEVMRYAAWVSSRAHASVMADTKPGMMEARTTARPRAPLHAWYHAGMPHSRLSPPRGLHTTRTPLPAPTASQYQLEALFLFHCAFHGGCRHQAYT